MKNAISALALVLSVTGCAYGLTSAYPAPLEPATSADVWLVRNRGFVGAAVNVKVALDGVAIAHVAIGEYMRFQLPPGTHTISADQGSLALNFESGQRYYLLISVGPKGVGFELERLSDAAGKDRVAQSKEVTARQ